MPGPVPDPDYVRQELARGDTWTLEVEFPGNDLSGWTWACQWRVHPSSEDVFATASVDTSQADEGLVTFTVAASVTAEIEPPATYHWDVNRTASGVVETVVAGRVEVYWDVTR